MKKLLLILTLFSTALTAQEGLLSKVFAGVKVEHSIEFGMAYGRTEGIRYLRPDPVPGVEYQSYRDIPIITIQEAPEEHYVPAFRYFATVRRGSMSYGTGVTYDYQQGDIPGLGVQFRTRYHLGHFFGQLTGGAYRMLLGGGSGYRKARGLSPVVAPAAGVRLGRVDLQVVYRTTWARLAVANRCDFCATTSFVGFSNGIWSGGPGGKTTDRLTFHRLGLNLAYTF